LSSSSSEDGDDCSSSNVGINLFLFLLFDFCWLPLLLVSSPRGAAATPCDDAPASPSSKSVSVGSIPVIHSLSSSSKASWTGFSKGSLSLLAFFALVLS
jgi:hypothetical protein